jgi:hypothetical protein
MFWRCRGHNSLRKRAITTAGDSSSVDYLAMLPGER